MSADTRPWHAEALDSTGAPLGAPISTVDAAINHLTATVVAHNIHSAISSPDDTTAGAAAALRITRALRPGDIAQTARAGLRLWAALHHSDDPGLAARADAALTAQLACDDTDNDD